ncbi:hypothetical protein F5Y10DRAFT_294461 [Nemania abortiva]|nr:hypothetical protein F5Y10DRAFT_294461 [Nemania abortiva]
MEQGVLDLRPLPRIQRLTIVTRTWANIRRVPLRENTGTVRRGNPNFALKKATQICILLSIQKAISSLSFYALVGLGIQLSDFGPSKQGFFPPFNIKDLCLRAVFSLQWVWDTYFILNLCHHVLALIFVAALRWDLPEEWPPLFGSMTEAYSLLRFWGIFWQRLHVVPFELFMPELLVSSHQKTRGQRGTLSGACRGPLRALWMFTLSALCHTAVNWIVLGQGGAIHELRFFLSNFCICLVEKSVAPWFKKIPGITILQFLSYIWVIIVFLCLVPNWRYPLILAELVQ